MADTNPTAPNPPAASRARHALRSSFPVINATDMAVHALVGAAACASLVLAALTESSDGGPAPEFERELALRWMRDQLIDAAENVDALTNLRRPA